MQISARECDVLQFVGDSEVPAVWICKVEGVSWLLRNVDIYIYRTTGRYTS
jgi:hypothetical protein